MRKNRSFWEINNEIERIAWDGVDVPEDPDTGLELEIPEEETLEAQLADLRLALHEKVENIGYVLLDQEDEIERLDKQIARLTKWRDNIKGRRKWLMWYCVEQMIRAGLRSVKGAFVRVSVRKSPVSSDYVKLGKKPDVENIDSRFWKEEISHKVDSRGAIRLHKKAVKHFEETGEKIDGYEIEGFSFHSGNHHLKLG